MLKESLEHQQHVRFSSETAERREQDTFSPRIHVGVWTMIL